MILENSIEEFIERFRKYAASGHLYPRLEGSPLLEFAAAGKVLYLLERTAPYAKLAGDVSVIVHPVIKTLKNIQLQPNLPPKLQPTKLESDDAAVPLEEHAVERLEPLEQLFVSGISGVHGVGKILELQKGFIVVQAQIPLVLGILDDTMPKLLVGEWLRFESEAVLHGFVI